MTFVTIICDIDGLPRAWGRAPTAEQSQAEAERQWKRRIDERTAQGILDRSEERGETTTTQEDPT